MKLFTQVLEVAILAGIVFLVLAFLESGILASMFQGGAISNIFSMGTTGDGFQGFGGGSAAGAGGAGGSW